MLSTRNVLTTEQLRNSCVVQRKSDLGVGDASVATQHCCADARAKARLRPHKQTFRGSQRNWFLRCQCARAYLSRVAVGQKKKALPVWSPSQKSLDLHVWRKTYSTAVASLAGRGSNNTVIASISRNFIMITLAMCGTIPVLTSRSEGRRVRLNKPGGSCGLYGFKNHSCYAVNTATVPLK